MSLSDISARMRQLREEKPAAAAPTVDYGESYRLRARMVGVLLRDARLYARREAADCATLLGISPAQIEAWEYGDETPTLPQLELLAQYLDVPISHFWSTNTLQQDQAAHSDSKRDFMVLRDRMIGALLRQARETSGLSAGDLGERCGLSAVQIEAFELGEEAIPMHVLAVLANAVNKNVTYFLETSSSIGEALALREAWKAFSQMPEGVRAFVSNPLNAGFIEIARMFSQMPADQLRKVGESFLDITM